MVLEQDDRDLIIKAKARQPKFNARELTHKIRDERSTPVTVDEVKEFLSDPDVQEKIETRKSYNEKNSEYKRKELTRKLRRLEGQLEDYVDRLDDASENKPATFKEVRKTLETIGKVIDEINGAESGGDQYIRIDQFNVEMLQDALTVEDARELYEKKTGLKVEEK